MLEVRDVHSFYGGAHVLQGVSLEVTEGKLVALMGRNGMGKTTLIRSIMGMKPPLVRQGEILFREENLVDKASHEIAAMGLGLCPQGRRVFADLSVEENLTVCAHPPRSDDPPGGEWDIDHVYQMFPRLSERQRHRGDQLSGGERQMLAIARALMTNADLLLMDEPSEGLAPILVEQLGDDLRRIKESGLPILLVEQNLGLAVDVADEMYIMDRGKIVFRGTPEELDADEELKHRYLGVGRKDGDSDGRDALDEL